MNRNRYELVSGCIFGIIALLQATRAVLQIPAHVGAHDVPVWISWVAVAAASSLSVWAFQMARESH
jgi:hypothetical protein